MYKALHWALCHVWFQNKSELYIKNSIYPGAQFTLIVYFTLGSWWIIFLRVAGQLCCIITLYLSPPPCVMYGCSPATFQQGYMHLLVHCIHHNSLCVGLLWIQIIWHTGDILSLINILVHYLHCFILSSVRFTGSCKTTHAKYIIYTYIYFLTCVSFMNGLYYHIPLGFILMDSINMI